ncbi:MAG TPA: class I SAM-dependent methyltransferase [Nitrospirae bacterium]|nr:class I SAM-dependent methyltransferase [Nitrospirota bacterium]
MKSLRSTFIKQCKLCNTEGVILYKALTDILGTIEGSWDVNKCPNCGLQWLIPMPISDDIYLAYSEYPTHEYERIKNKSLKERIKLGYLANKYGYTKEKVNLIDKILGLILLPFPFKRVSLDFWFNVLKGIKGKGRLLDIGCGNGELVEMMNNWGWQAEGIEVDYKAVDVARSRGLKVTQGDFLEIDLSLEAFDAIISSHVFEHVYEPIDFLKKCYKAIKPNGIICIATPNSESLQNSIFKKNWMALDAPRHLYLYNPSSMALCAKKANINYYEIKTTSRGSRFIASASLMIQKTGQYHWNDKIDFHGFFFSNTIELLEYIILLYKKNKGVEMLFIARK